MGANPETPVAMSRTWHRQNRIPFNVSPNNAQGDNVAHPPPRQLISQLEEAGCVQPLIWERQHARCVRETARPPHPVKVSHPPRSNDLVELTVHCRSGRAVNCSYPANTTVEAVLKDMVHGLQLRWPQVLCDPTGEPLHSGLTLDQCNRPSNLRIEVGSPTVDGWSSVPFIGSCVAPPPPTAWNMPVNHNCSLPISYWAKDGLQPSAIPVLGSRAPGSAAGRSCDSASLPRYAAYGQARVSDVNRLRFD